LYFSCVSDEWRLHLGSEESVANLWELSRCFWAPRVLWRMLPAVWLIFRLFRPPTLLFDGPCSTFQRSSERGADLNHNKFGK